MLVVLNDLKRGASLLFLPNFCQNGDLLSLVSDQTFQLMRKMHGLF